jgi:hypothetical protein
MSIRTAIYDLMNNVETDVYPLAAPQELTVPYAVYSLRRERIRIQGGTTVHNVFMTVHIYANKHSDCVSLASTIEGNMEMRSGTYGTDVIIGSNFLSESDDYIPQLDKYLITQEYQIFFD